MDGGYEDCPQSHTLAQKYGVKMRQFALAWECAKGVTSPIIGATKASHFDDAVSHNPEEGVKLLDVKK